MHGFLVIDKPEGMTSHQVVGRVRRLFGTKKVGHAGTLDPLATGVLPVALGEATKLLQFLLDGEKAYRAGMRLGASTDTQDCTGEIIATADPSSITVEMVHEAMGVFNGEISQIPPMYSALKRNGVPLYKLARKGEEVEREARRVNILSLRLEEVALPDLSFEVHCSKGTYVRTLCHDIGERLGVHGHLTTLRRIMSAGFGLNGALSLETIEDTVTECRSSLLIGLTDPFPGFPRLQLDPFSIDRLKNGIPPELGGIIAPPEMTAGCQVFLMSGEKPLAIALFAPERLEETRGDFLLQRVFGPLD